MIDRIKAFSNSIRLKIGYARFEDECNPEGESYFLVFFKKIQYESKV